MDNNESVDPESTLNYSENNVDSPKKQFTDADLTDAIKANLLDDTQQEATSEAEYTEETPEVESEGVEDNEVLSQYEEEIPEESETGQEEIQAQDEDSERGLPKGVKKRIDKLIAKKREAEDELGRLKTENERLMQEVGRPAQTQVNSKNPYSNISDAKSIQKEAEKAKQIRRWCEMNPDGGVVTDAQGNETEYTALEVRNIKIRALDALEEHLPAQMQYVQNEQQVESVVAKVYPWWKDKSSAERQIAEAFLQHFPEIKRFPDYKMVVGDYIRGIKSREATTRSNPQRPPSQPRSGSAPVSGQSGRKPTRLNNSSDTDELANIIASRFI
jgi:hypothetical protein